MQLFYNPSLLLDSKEITFEKDESRHICQVLRRKEGDLIKITNGVGVLFSAKLISVHEKRSVASITETYKMDAMSYHLHLAVAPTKLNDRYEWFLEKATEIGVSEITPIICDRSERKVIKELRYEKILQSAMKQSLKTYLPRLNEAITFKDFILNRNIESQHYIAHCEYDQKTSLKSQIVPNENSTILIGPEGDFSPEEIAKATEKGITAVSLGNSRLRTETAAIVACHTVALTNEN